MHSDPGAPAALAGARANAAAPRNRRIPFELLAAIAIVGVAAAGHFVAAALAAAIVVLGHLAKRGLHTPAAHDSEVPHASLAERALSTCAAWFMPLVIALSAAVLMRTGDVAFALTLLLVASPQALSALPGSSHIGWRALAALAAAALLGAALAGFVGFVAAALLQQLSMLVVHMAVGRRVPA